MQFLAKILPNNRLAQPPLGLTPLPGKSQSHSCKYNTSALSTLFEYHWLTGRVTLWLKVLSYFFPSHFASAPQVFFWRKHDPLWNIFVSSWNSNVARFTKRILRHWRIHYLPYGALTPEEVVKTYYCRKLHEKKNSTERGRPLDPPKFTTWFCVFDIRLA